MRAVIYSRVSHAEGQEVQGQEAVLTDWAERRGWTIVARFQEADTAWRDGHQRELARLVREARKGAFDAVIVFALDRLSRQGALVVLQLVNALGRVGVKVISYCEPWTESPGELAEILYSIAGWVARQESKRISERTLVGLASARRRGATLGRPLGARDKKQRKKRSPRLPIWATEVSAYA